MSEVASPLAPDSQTSGSSEDEADTISLSDSVLDYPTHWDRRYHKYKEGSYPFPNDDQEQARLDFQYDLMQAVAKGKLFHSPIKDPRRILDVGTGTGIWCVDLADRGIVPHAKIIGIDLSPIQPEEVPENVYFEVQDCSETDWERPLNSFDLVNSRCMLGSLEDFSQYIRTARKYIKPGTGYIECCDLFPQPLSDDNTIPENWAFKRWEETMNDGATQAGRPVRIANRIKNWMIDAGFVDVREIIYKIPIGGWPANRELKNIGKGWAAMVYNTLGAVSYKTMNEGLGMTREQVEVFLADVRRSLENRRVHAYHAMYVVYGRRPSAEEEKKLGWMQPPPVPSKKENTKE